MKELEKLAQLFEKQTEKDIFGQVSYHEEAKNLHMLAGKLLYRAEKESNLEVAKKLAHASKLILNAGDVLKTIK